MNVPVRYHIGGRTAAEIAASVERGVRDGRLPPGDRLPPVRDLAADLGLSPATAAAAYATLRRRGVVATAGRRGTRVAGRPPLPARPAPALPPAGKDLSSGTPDPALPPRP